MSGRDARVRAAVIFPGWKSDSRPHHDDVIVCNHKYFQKMMADRNAAVVLSKDDVDFFAAQIERYIREKNR